MNESQKRAYGLLSWVPLLIFTIGTIYFLYINGRLVEHKQFHEHEKVVLFAFKNYDQLFILGSIAGIVSLIVMLTFIVHLAKLKNVNDAQKISWIIFMVFFGAFAFPVFWYNVIRTEPQDQPLYRSLEEAKG